MRQPDHGHVQEHGLRVPGPLPTQSQGILFVEPEDILLATPAAETLLAARDLFLTKKIQHTFAGYAKGQIARIETHRRWLINPPTAKPDRKAYGLPERTVLPADQLSAAVSMMTKKVEAWEIDFGALDPAARLHMIDRVGTALAEMNMTLDNRYKAAGKLLGFSDNFLQILDLERKYKAAMDEWTHYEQWKKERNPARAELEAKYGYDTKHAMHLIRLARSCVETLRTGKLKVKRDDHAELLEIRNGKLSYDELFEMANAVMAQIPDAVAASPLPDAPDFDALEDLCVTVTSMCGDGGFAFATAVVDRTSTAVTAPRRKFTSSRMSQLVIEAIEAGHTRAIDIIDAVREQQPAYQISSIRNMLSTMKKAGVLGTVGDSCRFAYFVALSSETIATSEVES